MHCACASRVIEYTIYRGLQGRGVQRPMSIANHARKLSRSTRDGKTGLRCCGRLLQAKAGSFTGRWRIR